MIDSQKNQIVSILKKLRERLTNFSRRNVELYYKERSLSLNLSVNPYKKLIEKAENPDDDFLQSFSSVNSSNVGVDQLFSKGELNLTDYYLINKRCKAERDDQRASQTKKKILKTLDKIRLADDKFQREFGISGAWFLGPFLVWRDKHEYEFSDILISPLLRIPIDIKKAKGDKYKLILETSDYTVNPSLRLYLKKCCDIHLPHKITKDSLRDVVHEIETHFQSNNISVTHWPEDNIPKILPRRRPVKNEDGEIIGYETVDPETELEEWEKKIYQKTTRQNFVLLNSLAISQINASRIVLVEDYDRILNDFENNSLISELLLGKPVEYDASPLPEAHEIDFRYSEKDHALILSTDATQHKAVEYVNQLKAVSIQGPPGTGKSQTITNLIADNLKRGRKVLFVSEKKAALDVVYNRLCETNLSQQTALIHSADLNKKNLYDSFINSLKIEVDQDSEKDWESNINDLEESKKELHEYYQELTKIQKPSGLSYADILTLSAKSTLKEIKPEIMTAFSHLPFEEANDLEKKLNEVQIEINKFDDFFNHPWIHKTKDVVLTSSFQTVFFKLLNEISKKINQQKELSQNVSGIIGIDAQKLENHFSSQQKLDTALQIFNNLLKSESFEKYKIFFSNIGKALEDLNPILSTMHSNVLENLKRFQNEPSPEIINRLKSYWELPRGFFDFFTREYWMQRRLKKRYFKGHNDQIFKACKTYFEAQKTKIQLDVIFKSYDLNCSLKIFDSDEWLSLIKLNQILNTLNESFGDNICFQNHSTLRQSLQNLITLFTNLKTNLKNKHSLFDELNRYFCKDIVQDNHKNGDVENSLHQLKESLNDIQTINSILFEVESLQKKYKLNDLQNILQKFFPKDVFSKWGDHFFEHLVLHWHDNIKTSSSFLNRFNPDLYQKNLEHYQSLSSKQEELNRKHIHNHLQSLRTDLNDNSFSIKLLMRESIKKRKVKSPREMLETEAKADMLKLKPCWLMSPLSISQILPLEAGLFDIIIFDEASQVRVEDAIPSIYRAQKLVVVGDTKQMPPTSFFSGISDDDDDEFEDIPDSILDQALMVYPQLMLKWHFRSRFEALIAYSNAAFYQGDLVAVPNPNILVEGHAVQFTKIENATFHYRNGNPKEAQIVVEKAYELLQNEPNKSLGILALGQSQMKAIEKIIEERSETDKTFSTIIEKAYNRKDGEADIGLFIKNLENVQGDERDTILLSVGYAPHKIGKKLNKNFGPITKKGGERRLNVAITRAKQNIHVFCSFNPDDIETTEEALQKNAQNVYFGQYLKYVRAVSENNLQKALQILESFSEQSHVTSHKPTRLSLDVKKRLEEKGYKVSTQIGTCGFFIDLGVHHPNNDKTFLLGIECDGASLHSTPYAKERDKIRQALLKSRGWQVARIWPTDWAKDWQNQIEELDKKLKSLLR